MSVPAVKPPPEENEEGRMPLVEHLRELRDRLMKAIIGLFLGMGVSLFFGQELYDWITAPFLVALAETDTKGGLGMVNSPFEGFSTYMWISFLGGVTLASPIIAWQAWGFIAPALHANEKRSVLPLTISSTTLFAMGALFCYYAVFPIAFPFFLTVLPTDANLSMEGYLDASIKMMLAFGASFQLPVVVWFLARLGFVDHRDLIIYFRYAIVIIFVVAALLTPPDVISQVLLAIPLTLLYFISIIVAYFATTKVREPESPATAGT